MIQIQNVSKTYGKGATAFQALQDVSFEIPDGASVAIIGRSGSGKSTLMHAISGLDRPQTGQVIVDGQNILQLSAKNVDAFRSRKMGFIFQSFFVQADETCFANVSLPLEIGAFSDKDRKQLVDAALAKVELSDKRNAKARDLSGGQKQRLAIARAIVNSPRTSSARSCILRSPYRSPVPRTMATSNPQPSSMTRRPMRPSSYRSSTHRCCACPCRTALLTASCPISRSCSSARGEHRYIVPSTVNSN